jgi:hypothetical protein
MASAAKDLLSATMRQANLGTLISNQEAESDVTDELLNALMREPIAHPSREATRQSTTAAIPKKKRAVADAEGHYVPPAEAIANARTEQTETESADNVGNTADDERTVQLAI